MLKGIIYKNETIEEGIKKIYKKKFNEYQKNQIAKNLPTEEINFFIQELNLLIKKYQRGLYNKNDYIEHRNILENEYLF